MVPLCGKKAIVRIFGVDAHFDGVATLSKLVLPPGQRRAAGHRKLRADEIDADDLLGHRMLDLQPRVHLEKIEVAFRRDDELDGAGAAVVDAARRRHRRRGHALAKLVAVARRRRLLDHLLMPPLDGAVALEEVDDVAFAVAEDLKLDVPRLLDVALEQKPVVAE